MARNKTMKPVAQAAIQLTQAQCLQIIANANAKVHPEVVKTGRCKDALDRVTAAIRNCIKAGDRTGALAQVGGLIGDEIGKTRVVAAETMQLGEYLKRTPTRFRTQLLDKFLAPVKINHAPRALAKMLAELGWDGLEGVSGLTLAWVPQDATLSTHTDSYTMATLLRYKDLLILCDRSWLLYANITSSTSFSVAGVAKRMTANAVAVGNGGQLTYTADAKAMLERAVGFLTFMENFPNEVAYDTLPVSKYLDNSGTRTSHRNVPPYSTGAWKIRHFRNGYTRIINGRKVKTGPCIVNAAPTLLEDRLHMIPQMQGLVIIADL